MKTLFITGAGGFIGRHVVARALHDGHAVRALVRDPESTVLSKHPDLQLVAGSLDTVSDQELRGCDVLVHLAACGVSGGMNDWEKCFRVNVTDSLALWRRAVDAGIKRFIICGSCFEYGRSGERYEFIPVDAPLEPTGAYHASKAAASMAAWGLAVDKNLELAILRPFHVYGEGEAANRFWPSLRQAALNGMDFPMSDGSQVRDFVTVEQVARDVIKVVSEPALEAGRPLTRNLGTGQPQSLLAFAASCWSGFGAKGKLHPGVIPTRSNEVKRYVPMI